VRDNRHAERRRADEADRQESDRTHVRTQIPHRGEESGRVEQRRKKCDEHELGRQLELGQSRHERERETAENEEDRIRDPHGRREDEQGADPCEKGEQLPELLPVQVHPATIVSPLS
jgi:hypothetical protein